MAGAEEIIEFFGAGTTLAPLDRYISDELTLTNIGTITKVEIYPIITAGTCRGQVISTTNFENVQDQPLSTCK